jgi:mannose/cellobiose epimerase-like protein (N-acyl-D-glucosamine 2-epimerase family)
MTDRADFDAKAELRALHPSLVAWLVNDAYPLWKTHGIDAQGGGFIEALGQNGVGLPDPRRARVHPRQVYAFAQARTFGWRGDVRGIVRSGMEYFTAHYRRSDGLFRALVAADGAILDDRALLYDQAFALFGFAAAAGALDARSEFEERALALRGHIEAAFSAADGSFHSQYGAEDIVESNPHMHLLEACLAWANIGEDAGWAVWVRRLVEVAVSRFIRKDSGAIGESYTAEWRPSPGLAGRLIEPGHQFEWGWLLLRSESLHPVPLREKALRLLQIGEQHGVHCGAAVNQLFDDFTIADPGARCWPQTERLKAALLAATITGDPHYWRMAHAAASSLLPYLNTAVPGLWFDLKKPDGAFVDSPAPASTFYHVVGALVALSAALHTPA